jgi:hypothetical protein
MKRRSEIVEIGDLSGMQGDFKARLVAFWWVVLLDPGAGSASKNGRYKESGSAARVRGIGK